MLIQQTSHTSQWGEKTLIPNKNMFVRCSSFDAHIKKRQNFCAKQPLPVFTPVQIQLITAANKAHLIITACD